MSEFLPLLDLPVSRDPFLLIDFLSSRDSLSAFTLLFLDTRFFLAFPLFRLRLLDSSNSDPKSSEESHEDDDEDDEEDDEDDDEDEDEDKAGRRSAKHSIFFFFQLSQKISSMRPGQKLPQSSVRS